MTRIGERPTGERAAQHARRDLVLDYLTIYEKKPKRWIARALYGDHPELFKDLEAARKSVRYYTSANGKQSASTAAKRYAHMARKGPVEQELPPTLAEERLPYNIPKSIKKLGVISDTHVPFHDLRAMEIALSYLESENVDGLLLNGDLLDMYNCSFHERVFNKVTFAEEMEAGRQLLRHIRQRFPGIRIWFKAGNHEARMERFLAMKARELLGTNDFLLRVLLRLDDVEVEWLENKRLITAGKLNIIHGDEYRGAGGVNPARWLSLRTRESTLCGHFHRESEHRGRTISGQQQGWWSTGCLCELQPEWMPYNDWSHGFAIVNLEAEGLFAVENYTIVDGKVRG